MIKKFNEYGKVNESESERDYYDMFEFEEGGHKDTIELGYVGVKFGDKSYYFDVEVGEDVFNVYLDGDNSKKELEDLGVTFHNEDGRKNVVNDKPFEDFIFDMYSRSGEE